MQYPWVFGRLTYAIISSIVLAVVTVSLKTLSKEVVFPTVTSYAIFLYKSFKEFWMFHALPPCFSQVHCTDKEAPLYVISFIFEPHYRNSKEPLSLLLYFRMWFVFSSRNKIPWSHYRAQKFSIRIAHAWHSECCSSSRNWRWNYPTDERSI